MENVSNTSTTIVSNVISTLKDIVVNNINRLIFGHLNINSLRNKFDFLCEQIYIYIYIVKYMYIAIFMLSESKLDDSFQLGHFLIDGFHALFRFDRDKNGGGILYMREDIPARVLSPNFPSGESFFVEIILHRKKSLINCSFNPNEKNIKNHVETISRTLDTFCTEYENILLLGDLNACVDGESMQDFGSFYCLKSLIKQPWEQ